MNWKIMRELNKPFKGFEYECAEGHTWQIRQEDWEERGANDCAQCQAARAAAVAEAQAGGENSEVAAGL